MAKEKGHNSGDDVLSLSAARQLRAFVERVERVEEDQAALAYDKKDIYAEAKGVGFDVKIVRKVVKLRKTDKVKLQEEEALIDLYLCAIGEVPAGQADEDDDDDDIG